MNTKMVNARHEFVTSLLAVIYICAGVHQAAAQPVVSFTEPTDGQIIVTFSGLAIAAQTDAGTIQQVTFSIYNQFGQCWDGTNFQGAVVSLPTSLSGTNWVPASGLALPDPCCGQSYQLDASATDTHTNTGTTYITVTAATQPIVSFTEPTDGQIIATFSGLTIAAQTDAGTIQQVTFSIYNQSTGQWWNGANFQGAWVSLPTSLSGTNWVPASGLALPDPYCGQYYQLVASATDTHTNTGTTYITVQANDVPPVVSFTQPTNGQQIVTFSNLAMAAQTDAGTIQQVTFSIYNQSGQRWNGTNFQDASVSLPTSLSGTNWVPASGLALPDPSCGQYYQLSASATDSLECVGTTNITVTADSVPPVISFSPLTDGETVTSLSAIGGTVTDSFTSVASVVFSIQEVDHGCSGRWWNGANFQSNAANLPAVITNGVWSPAPGFVFPKLNSGQSYQIVATATNAVSCSASDTIIVTDFITVLTWDRHKRPGKQKQYRANSEWQRRRLLVQHLHPNSLQRRLAHGPECACLRC